MPSACYVVGVQLEPPPPRGAGKGEVAFGSDATIVTRD